MNELPLEDYVAGSVLGEVSETWGDALLRAQSVAIRTYALHRRATAAERGYDVEADTRALVYIGLDGETSAVRDAVAATRGQVLTYDGEPILAAFHSTAGGRTASAGEVWGRDVFVTDRVVDTHMVKLRRKMEADPEKPRLIVSVRGIGYRFES